VIVALQRVVDIILEDEFDLFHAASPRTVSDVVVAPASHAARRTGCDDAVSMLMLPGNLLSATVVPNFTPPVRQAVQ
jgi:hypothetical protein